MDTDPTHLAERRWEEQIETGRQRSLDDAMSELAHLFPTLIGAPGVCPWDPAKLASFAASGKLGSGGLNAARFVLYVWNPRDEWESLDRFDLADALASWDHIHTRAWKLWAINPWFA